MNEQTEHKWIAAHWCKHCGKELFPRFTELNPDGLRFPLTHDWQLKVCPYCGNENKPLLGAKRVVRVDYKTKKIAFLFTRRIATMVTYEYNPPPGIKVVAGESFLANPKRKQL